MISYIKLIFVAAFNTIIIVLAIAMVGTYLYAYFYPINNSQKDLKTCQCICEVQDD